MLEKTAASLEPCGLQRVLPGAKNSLQSRRQLHTAFWQHGAADVELTNAWQALMHGVLDSSNTSSSRPGDLTTAPAIRASTFLLDFLYPSGSLAFLRRFSPTSVDRFDPYRQPHSFAKVSPRLYTSSAPLRQARKDSEETNSPQQEDTETLNEDETTSDLGPPISETVYGVEQRSEGLQATKISADDVAKIRSYARQLAKLLAREDPQDADQVWYHYNALDAQSQGLYRARTLSFLSKTHRVTDSWKIIELFQLLASSEWEGYSFLAALRAQLNLGNEDEALDIFGKALKLPDIDDYALAKALDMLLTAAFKSADLDFALNFATGIWQFYETLSTRFDLRRLARDFHQLASVPGLAEKVLSIKDYLTDEKQSPLCLEAREALLKLLVRRALVNCAFDQVEPLLLLTKEFAAFEQYLHNCQDNRQRLHIAMYKIYRTLPGALPSASVLLETFRVYESSDQNSVQLAGAELIWGDWHRFHEMPSRRAFQKFLAFYAAQGNKERVFSLWSDYLTRFPDLDVIKGDDTFTYLLQVHAVREEVGLVQTIFDDISGKFGMKPNRHCWNILLNAYVKAADYTGAIRTFEELSLAVGSDRYSFGTMMQMAASRGDLGFTINLYRRGRRKGAIENDPATLAALVEAYCQNDHFHEAEDVCIRSAKKGLKDTWLWNRLLNAYGMRRNLASINRLLNVMTDLDIPYDPFTYQFLLLGLGLCRQPQHALALLAVAIKERAFEVSQDHFLILMGAFIKTGEPQLVIKIHELMEECGVRPTSSSMTQVMTALAQWQKMPMWLRRTKSFKGSVGKAMRRFYKTFSSSHRDDAKRLSTRSRNAEEPSATRLLESDRATFQLSRMIYLFTQMKDLTRTYELLDLYRLVVYGDKDSANQLPIQLLDSLMWAEYAEKNYDGVRRIWDIALALAKEGGVSMDRVEGDTTSPRISPRYAYVLSDGLKVMQHVCMATEDSLSLQKLMEEVTEAGFEIDSKNWNLHIQFLVRLKAYEPAFSLCEKHLMPNWTGWAIERARANVKNELPLDMRRRGRAPRFLRIVTHTMYYLARGYMELERMSPWSDDAARLMRYVESDAPRCYRAIMSMTAINSDMERQILEGAEPGEILARIPEELPTGLEISAKYKNKSRIKQENGINDDSVETYVGFDYIGDDGDEPAAKHTLPEDPADEDPSPENPADKHNQAG